MPSPNLQLIGGNFQNGDGVSLSGGKLLFTLSHDEQYTVGSTQVVAGQKFTTTLDSTGNIPANPAFRVWANDAMLPSGSFYTVRLFDSSGAEVWAAPQFWTLASSPNPLNVGTIVPSNPPGAGTSGGLTLLLQTNSVNNGDQSLLNLKNGTGVTIADDGVGGVTINAGGGVVSLATAGQTGFYGPGMLIYGATPGSGSAGVSLVKNANEVWAVKFILNEVITVRKVVCSPSNNVGSNFLGFAIYDTAGTTRLINSGAFALSTAGVPFSNTLGSPVILSPGEYWFAQTTTSAAGGTCEGVSLSTSIGWVDIMNKNATRIGLSSNAGSGGICPTSLGTITALTTATAAPLGIGLPYFEP